LSRYDLLLAVIPVLFMAAVLAYLFTPLSLHLAMGASAVTSGLLVADAVYFHPPTDARDVADAESVVERSAHDGE
jgi:membrane associated rhomboid family serine protease